MQTSLEISLSLIESLSNERREPSWMTNWRINAFYCLLASVAPVWSEAQSPIVGPQVASTFEKCEQSQMLKTHNRNVDVVYNSTSVYLNITNELQKLNILFLPLSKAILLCPKLIRRYMGSVVYHNDNYYSALNAAVFTDGTFVNVPKGVHCPMSLSTYFKITPNCAGQFERTLIIADPQSKIAYFEGCNSGKLNKFILHSAVVEIVVKDFSNLKYTTFQNWSNHERGGIYNYVTKRALVCGKQSKMIWVQVEIGSNSTWKYPSTILAGFNSRSEFYSLSISNRNQRVDTGTKCLHLAEGSSSTVLAKSIVMGQSLNIFRALVLVEAKNCRSHIKCDSLITSKQGRIKTFPTIKTISWPLRLEYESLNSYITERQLAYCSQRGLNEVDAIKLIISGHASDIVQKLPLEAAVEISKLMIL
ncbi:MAG: Fe-S cluster assembly protein SufB [Candidatus Hodgkinia cicadicola]